MYPIATSASMVLYKPDFPVVEQTLLALQQAGLVAKQNYTLQLSLTLVDNSDDAALHLAIADWYEGFRTKVPDWNLSLVRAPANLGYGRGNNLAIAGACSDYHLVINPDLFVDPDAILEALRFMESHADVGLLSPAVFGKNGDRHFLCKRHPTLMIMFLRSFAPFWLKSSLRFVLNKFEMRDCNYDKPIHPVEYPTGCFMFFRTGPLQAIGGFDPDYFLHYEDADIGRRILEVARVFYVPSVRATHLWTRDSHYSFRAKLRAAKSGFLYWQKWGGIFWTKSEEDLRDLSARFSSNQTRDPVAGYRRHVLVTGANGFIGQAVCADLPSRGYSVRSVVRGNSEVCPPNGEQRFVMENLDERSDWTAALAGIDSVVHLVGRVHLMQDTAADPLADCRRINAALTLNLARQAAIAGVRRFVFVSSIKVNGEATPFGQPFTAEDEPRPQDPYAVSKYEAEQALMQLAEKTGMEVVILRPVIVYGPGVKANFQEMMRWIRKGVPLPLGWLDNRRSLVALDNLVDCIAICLHHPAAANQIFLVSDGEDITVEALLRRTAAALGRRARLLPVPKFVLGKMGRLVGKEASVQRLCTSLQVDISKTRQLLRWDPPVSLDVALMKAVQQFREE